MTPRKGLRAAANAGRAPSTDFAYARRMMRSRSKRAAAIAASLALVACDREGGPSTQGGPAPSALPAPTAAAATRAVITMDASHDMMAVKDAHPYAIAPSAELVVEIGDYHFTARDAGAPDAVHVAHGSSGYYRASFSGKQIRLNAASLDTVKGREAFPGFEAGESYLVAVGAEAPSASDGALRFKPVWTAKVDVAPR